MFIGSFWFSLRFADSASSGENNRARNAERLLQAYSPNIANGGFTNKKKKKKKKNNNNNNNKQLTTTK